MGAFVSKLTSMVTETGGALTALLLAIAFLSLVVVVIMAVVTHNDERKAAKIKTIIWILVLLAFFASIGAVVSWASS